MTDRPIIFSGPMVRALLDGRKTQTRRVLKPRPGMQAGWLKPEVLHAAPTCHLATYEGHFGVQMQHPQAGKHYKGIDIDPMSPLTWVRLPYALGDRLYVRESIARQETDQGIGYQTFAADGRNVWPLTEWYHKRPSIPSIHMPRWASRLTLTVTDVRVQRLQDISAADSIAEGVQCETCTAMQQSACHGAGCFASAQAFRDLWNSLHGPDAWAENPWVVALTFTVRHGNIDKVTS